MSKQSEAKERQGYVPKAIPEFCGNCAHFRCDTTVHPPAFSYSKPYTTQSNLRCTLGGFAIKKQGTCNEWSATPSTAGD